MARRSQCSDAGDNPLDPNYLPPHYREDYRLAIDSLIEEDLDGYFKFLQAADVVDFLAPSEVDYIQHSIQLPKQSANPEHRYFDPAGTDGSSDTYWPMHSDLDAPGLDLGWPQIGPHFIGPAEVTTLVNPAAPDMPSIKEQARRLIKNAQMVIAVVMDVFSDVDIFADILNAATRNVAVYLLLDEANIQDFIRMVHNCRVNLQAIQYLRVRTVTGITYHCRTGKSFKGRMLDRFILTDCRAVLSGNYSFMWSYEKLHRCMAHLFLGQLVSTFDEEFRILFAQSEPLDIVKMEEVADFSKRPYPGDRPLIRDSLKYRSMDLGPTEEWNRPSYEENMDWRIKRQETFHGPLDVYNRYPPPLSRLDPQTRLEPPFDQGPTRMMDSLAHKRHNFAEPGRYNVPYQHPGLPDVEPPGRPLFRGQPHLHPGHEPEYGSYGHIDKFWNQDFQQEDPYPEQGYPQEIDQQNFDPVLNYLSSARNVDIDQGSDNMIPGPDMPYSTLHPHRHIGQTFACHTSPTPSNTTEKKLMSDLTSDRKDPTVKRGLRNWRISSYLSAYDNSEELEGLPTGPGQTVDPFDDVSHPMQQPTPPPHSQALDLAVPKIPNVREFKVPPLPRPSQMPAYGKTTLRDYSKKVPDEITQLLVPPGMVVSGPKAPTPTPSDSSSTTDGEKQEEAEAREPITSVLRREDPLRGKYNAAVQRGSRLKSSLIFQSLDQKTPPDGSEQDEDKTKTETDQAKLQFVSQRRSGASKPFEWRSYLNKTDKTEEDSKKQTEDSKLESLSDSKETKTKEVTESLEVVPLPKTQIEQRKIDQQPLPTVQHQAASQPFVDMNDPDQRFSFFKELAAKRRAEKAAAEEAKLKQKEIQDKQEKVAQVQKDELKSASETTKDDTGKEDGKTLSGKIESVDCEVKENPTPTQSCYKSKTKIETEKLKQSQPSLPTSTEKLAQEKPAPQESDVPKSTEKQDERKKANVGAKSAKVEQVAEKDQLTSTNDATSKESLLKPSNSGPDLAKTFGLDLSSLPSARMYERSLSQESSKDTNPKPRLWTPTIHRREFLKPFGEKQKSISTVIQIEDVIEDPSQTNNASESDKNVKFEICDKTSASENSSQSLSETKQLPKEETLETSSSKSDNTLSDIANKSLKSVSQTKEATIVTPIVSPVQEKMSIAEKSTPQIKESPENSTRQSTQTKEETKDLTSTAKGKDLSLTESKKEELVKSPETIKSSQSLASEEPEKEVNPSKDDESQDKTKTEPKQQVDQSEQVSNSDQNSDKLVGHNASQNSSEKVEPQKQDVAEKCKLAPESAIDKPVEKQSTSEKGSEEVIKNIPSSSKDDTKKADSMETKASAATKEGVELSAGSNLASKKENLLLQSDKIEKEGVTASAMSADETKQRPPFSSTEEGTPLESHSDTSSPASFATALEFISSEDSDFLSPVKNDPQNLFKKGSLESSVSDMSDFQTPNSDISMSPMPSAFGMDEMLDDNVSVAETVIEAGSRRKAASPDEGRGEMSQTSVSQEVSVKDGGKVISNTKQVEQQQKPSSSETSFDSVNSATKQSDSSTDLAKEILESGSKVTNETTNTESEKQEETSKLSTTSPETEVTKDLTSGDKGSEISCNIGEESKESLGSTGETKTIKVYSRFEAVPTRSAETTASAVASNNGEEVKIADKTSETKTTVDTSIETKSKTDGVGSNLQTSKSETELEGSNESQNLSEVESNANPETPEAQTGDISDIKTGSAYNEKIEKDGSKTDVPSIASEVGQSTESENMDDKMTVELRPVETADIESHVDVSNVAAVKDEKTESTSEILSNATSEMTTDATSLDKESKTSKDISKTAAGEGEQKSKDTNDNTKENTSISDLAAQQKQQQKSRYLSSTANVISSSNLRDDTKILLEQISANSQTRNESSTVKEAPVTDDEKEDEADKNAKRKNELRSSLASQKPTQERDKLLERIQTMRKDRKVYSRFEV
ncbi:unnamed protein product [Knipowitschia caucasica]